ncbi:MAG: NAD(P)H-dependent oxidoreductase subunit E [Planctomycetota bacterium]|nr:MAG: NAD(P)H-dependent oxidoreductase subunit E [Planctomycetota bacterium]
MSWKAVERAKPPADPGPGLSEPVREKIRSFFPRYPTKRAVMLPALHIIQDALGYVSFQAMRDLAELLDVAPSEVADVVSFYSMFWTHPRGRKTIMLCRSISCELMGGREVKEALQQKLGIGEHETTPDGEWSLMTEECLAACEHAPCMLINEKMHKCVKVEDLERILNDPDNDKLSMPRSDLFDAPRTK